METPLHDAKMALYKSRYETIENSRGSLNHYNKIREDMSALGLQLVKYQTQMKNDPEAFTAEDIAENQAALTRLNAVMELWDS